MADYRVVIPSRDAGNLTACVDAIYAQESGITAEQIIVVDDGARAGCAYAEARGREYLLSDVTWITGIKPFVFARNVNLGLFTPIGGEYQDAIVLNDDAELETPQGFTLLSGVARLHPEYGIIGAAISGAIGNLRQRPQAVGLRTEPRMVCFIAVYIPLATLQTVGPLDERFTGYGFDDDDYCRRIRNNGKLIGIFDGCIVGHGRLPSTFRHKKHSPLEPNQAVYEQKWGRLEPWR